MSTPPTKSLALELAEALEAVPETGADPDLIQQSALELRRLAAVEQEYERIRALEPVAYADPLDLAKDGNWDTFIVKHASEHHEGLRFLVGLYTLPPNLKG